MTSCVPYKYSTRCFVSEECCAQEVCAADHWLYQVIPRHRAQIRWYDAGHWCTWAFFGNDDDGIFGEANEYCPTWEPSPAKALCWNLRNPLHNFFFYVIGSAHCTNSAFVLCRLSREKCELLQYYPESHVTFAGEGPSFYLALHGWKPFVSTRLLWTRCKETRFYVGWRGRGNFGLTVVPLGNRKSAKTD